MLMHIFFEFDQGGRRGHSRKLFKKEVDSMSGSRPMCLAIELSISGTLFLINVLTLTRLIVLSLIYQSMWNRKLENLNYVAIYESRLYLAKACAY